MCALGQGGPADLKQTPMDDFLVPALQQKGIKKAGRQRLNGVFSFMSE